MINPSHFECSMNEDGTYLVKAVMPVTYNGESHSDAMFTYPRVDIRWKTNETFFPLPYFASILNSEDETKEVFSITVNDA